MPLLIGNIFLYMLSSVSCSLLLLNLLFISIFSVHVDVYAIFILTHVPLLNNIYVRADVYAFFFIATHIYYLEVYFLYM